MMIKDRNAAGWRYAKAVEELLNAYVDLAAHDSFQPSGPGLKLNTFSTDHALVNSLAAFRHREYVPTLPKAAELLDRIAARKETLRHGVHL
jgi:hypothetical protein